MDPTRIVGTAEWYYKRWPKFYNDECYQILADFTAHPEKYLKDNKEEEECVEEKKDSYMETKDSDSENNKNRERKVCVCGFDSEQCEHVISV